MKYHLAIVLHRVGRVILKKEAILFGEFSTLFITPRLRNGKAQKWTGFGSFALGFKLIKTFPS